jgi:L-malate glycosyltransferase
MGILERNLGFYITWQESINFYAKADHMTKNQTMLILANADSIHTYRWVKSLSPFYKKIILFSFENIDRDYTSFTNLIVYSGNSKIDTSLQDGHFSKLKYLKNVFTVNKLIDKYQPEIVHAYYASSYGLLAYLSKAKQFHISLWGSDVLQFPFKSFLHRFVFQLIMSKANKVFSTSEIMIEEASRLFNRDYVCIPFGVDTDYFFKSNEIFIEDKITLGITKSLEKIYGIDILINAVSLLHKKDINVFLKIAGRGSEDKTLKELVNKLNLGDYIEFSEHLDHYDLNKFYNSVDIACFPSRSESFGVSVLEANSCGRPVVVSNVGGLPSIVTHELNGLIVENKTEIIAKSLEELITNKDKARKMGEAGRELVLEHYQWQNSVDLKMKELGRSYD